MVHILEGRHVHEENRNIKGFCSMQRVEENVVAQKSTCISGHFTFDSSIVHLGQDLGKIERAKHHWSGVCNHVFAAALVSSFIRDSEGGLIDSTTFQTDRIPVGSNTKV